MFILFSLILSSYAQVSPLVSPQCTNVTLFGSVIAKQKQLYFVTHQNSQEEKEWKIKLTNPKEKLHLSSFEKMYSKVEAQWVDPNSLTKNPVIIIKNIERSPLASEIARSSSAVQIETDTKCTTK